MLLHGNLSIFHVFAQFCAKTRQKHEKMHQCFLSKYLGIFLPNFMIITLPTYEYLGSFCFLIWSRPWGVNSVLLITWVRVFVSEIRNAAAHRVFRQLLALIIVPHHLLKDSFKLLAERAESIFQSETHLKDGLP